MKATEDQSTSGGGGGCCYGKSKKNAKGSAVNV